LRLLLKLCMTIVEFIIYLVIAGVCGAIARALVGGTGRSFVLSIFLGFMGAFVGTWLARILHLPRLVAVAVAGHPFPIVWSIVGGVLLAAFAHALTRTRHFAH
jgi:uncharacterized membrane protein YeaQ/YmgE (transglycosylase-associated protein family)